MGASPDNLIEDAERHATSDEFYWAVGEVAKAAKANGELAEALEAALRWCIDHNVTLSLTPTYVNIMLPTPYHHMVWGPTFLDAVEQGRTWIEGFEHA